MADLPQSYQLPMSGPTSFTQTASLAGLEPSVQSLSGGWDTSGFKNISDATWKAGADQGILSTPIAELPKGVYTVDDGAGNGITINKKDDFSASVTSGGFQRDFDLQSDYDGRIANMTVGDVVERAEPGAGGYNQFEAALDAHQNATPASDRK